MNNKGAPVSITLQRPTPKEAGVVEGWVRGVPGMRVGGRRLLEVPSHLGYGNQGSRNGKVPPHADLTFDIELVGLE